jgi:purine-cytosine permease-like protein
MLAWMCSGVMVAAVAREMNPGLMAYEAAGFAGALAVLVAGWTTANPTLYRAGLAFQAVSPNWPRWRVTLLAGALTTIVSCFPIIFMRLLDYVAMYGLVVVPVGSVVFCEHVIFPRIGVKPISGMLEAVVNKSAAIAWGATVAAVFATPIHPFYKPVLAWVVGIVIYAAIRKASGGER